MIAKNKAQDKIDQEVSDFMDDVFSYVDNDDNQSQETAITMDPSQLLSKMVETSKSVQSEKLRSKKRAS
jgi:hypothetical protein